MNQPTTLNELFNGAVECHRDRELLRFKKAAEWQSLTFGEMAQRVRELALGLYDLGIRQGDKIAIWSENRPEWNVADLAILALGAVDVPIYTTQSRHNVEYILNDAKTRAIFISTDFLYEALALRERVPSLEFIFSFDSLAEEKKSASVFNAEELTDKGRVVFQSQPNLYESLWKSVKPEALATLIYTSGTTGDPKGVMLSHENLTVNVLNVYEWLALDKYEDVALTFLPFSHIFERAVWYLYVHCATVIAYAESIDTVAANLAEVQPTVMTSVPRMFEKFYARIVEKGLAAGFPKRQIFLWSLGIGKRWAERKDRGLNISAWLALQHKIADALVFTKWRAAMGGRVRAFISGGAPLASEIAYAFYGAGILILQGYGLTETSPSMTCNTEAHNRIGTVGRVIDGVSVKIAEDGEILVKGKTVMQGYYHRPEINQESFTEDGWFRTGDIGQFDDDGFLSITDRKKDLLKTSGGKYVAPQPLESLIKSSRFVSQVVVIGNNRKFVAALIVPNLELVKSYAEMKGIRYGSDDELLSNAKIIDLLQRQIDKFTQETAKYERIKKIALLSKEMTAESGELTPTLKPRRKIIETKYAEVIDKLYAETGERMVAV
ncbi:MAG: long-chain fatty acid--CoA ligase [Acidobacteria bacterium]|nr:long-chain fatty acid--CoA ligase [Acidobacteriota bacterium]